MWAKQPQRLVVDPQQMNEDAVPWKLGRHFGRTHQKDLHVNLLFQ